MYSGVQARVLKRSNTTYRQRVIFSVPRKGPPCIKNSTGSTETANFFGLKPETLRITSASNNVLLWSTFEVLLRTQTKTPGYSFWGLKSGTPDPPPCEIQYYSTRSIAPLLVLWKRMSRLSLAHALHLSPSRIACAILGQIERDSHNWTKR